MADEFEVPLINTGQFAENLSKPSTPGFGVFETSAPINLADGNVFWETFLTENTVASLVQNIRRQNRLGTVIEEGFSPGDNIPYGYEQWSGDFAVARSFDDILTIKNAIDRENNQRALSAQRPWKAFFSGIAANMVSPESWLPMGLTAKQIKAGVSIERAAYTSAFAAGGQTAIQELGLSTTQITRDFDESMFNTAAATMLGAAFGGMGGAVMGGRIGKRATGEIAGEMANGPRGPVPDGTPRIQTTSKAGFAENAENNKIIEGRFSVDEQAPGSPAQNKAAIEEVQTYGTPKGVGANIIDFETLKDAEALWKIQPFVDKYPGITPYFRTQKSIYATAREAGNALVETNFYSNKHFQGVATTNLETRIKGRLAGLSANMLLDIRDAYLTQKGVSTRAPIFRDIAAKMSGTGMDMDRFLLETTKAVRRGGEHEIPEIAALAQKLDQKYITPLRDEAIESGIFGPDVDPVTARGYITKLYDTVKIAQDHAMAAEQGGKKFVTKVYNAFKQNRDALDQMMPRIKEQREAIKLAENPLKEQKKKAKELKRLQKSVFAEDKAVKKALGERDRILKDASKQADDRIKAIKQKFEKKLEKELDKLGKTEDLIAKQKKIISDAKETASKNLDINKSEIEAIVDDLRKRQKPGIQKAQKTYAKERAQIRSQLKSVVDEAKLKLAELEGQRKQLDKGIKSLQKEFKSSESAQIKKIKDKEKALNKKIDEQKKKITAVKEQIKKLEKDLNKNKIEDLQANVDKLIKELDDSVPRILKRYNKKKGVWEIPKIADDEALWVDANNVVEGLIGSGDNRFDNPLFDLGSGGKNPNVTRQRVLMVMDEAIEDFLVNDTELLMSTMIRGIVPQIELKRFAATYGADSLESLKSEIKGQLLKEFNTLLEQGKIKDVAKAIEIREQNLSDIEAMIDINMGIYGSGYNVLSNKMKDIYKNFRDWNFTRFGGFMGLASIMEPLAHALKVGPGKLIMETILPKFKDFASSTQSLAREKNTQILRSMGYGLQSSIGSVERAMLNGEGLGVRASIWRRVFSGLSDVTAELSGLKKIQDISENVTGLQVISDILADIDAWANGKLDPKKEANLNKLGLNKQTRKFIHEQWTDKGGIDDGAYWLDPTAMDVFTGPEAEHYRVFRDAIKKEVDTSVVKTGTADVPLVAHRETGKTLFQFKFWASGATNRLAIAGFQRNDIEFYLGASYLIFGGIMSHIIVSALRGQEIDWDPDKLLLEGIDRSGLLGIMGEAANIVGKGLFGTNAARYNSRTLAGAIMGPTLGAPDEVIKLLNKGFNASIPGGDPLTVKDFQYMQRLVPLQNMWFLYAANKAMTDKVAIGLGAKE